MSDSPEPESPGDPGRVVDPEPVTEPAPENEPGEHQADPSSEPEHEADRPESQQQGDTVDRDDSAATVRRDAGTETATEPRVGESLVDAVETGMAGLFAALERGVLSMVGNRNPTDTPADDAGHEAGVTLAAAAPASPTVSDTAGTDPTTAPTRAPLTYDDVLKPIQWKLWFGGAALAVALAAIYFAATFAQVWAAADNDNTQEADAIVVLGAAQFDGTPSPVFAARLDHALTLWEQGLAPLIVTTGSKQEGDRFTEGFSGYVYLLERGVPDDQLVPVVDGGDTWEQLSATSNQLEERELSTALLVSDGYHTFRLLAMAEELGLEAWASPTDVEPTMRDYLREATAVSVGRIVGYRRVSAVSTPD